MTFTTQKYLSTIQKLLSAPKIDDSVLISAGNSVIDDIVNWSGYTFNFLKKIDSTKTTIIGQNYIDISTITDYNKIIDIFYNEIKPENRLYQKSSNAIFSLGLNQEIFEISDVEYSNTLPRFYADDVEPNKIYFDKNHTTEETLIIIYKKNISLIATLAEAVPIPDNFEVAYYHGLVEYSIPAAQNIQNFSTDYYRNTKYARLRNIMRNENLKEYKYTGFNSNYQIGYISHLNKILNPTYY